MRATTRLILIPIIAVFAIACTTDSVFVSPSKPHGILEFKTPDTTYNPARMVMINDQNIVGSDVRRTSFWVKPGEYTIELAMASGSLQSVGAGRASARDQVNNKLQITVEEGKRYLIAARVTGGQIANWEGVVWKVEDL